MGSPRFKASHVFLLLIEGFELRLTKVQLIDVKSELTERFQLPLRRLRFKLRYQI